MVKSKLHSFNGEQKLDMSQAEMDILLENMISQFSYYRMVYDAEGRPVDYIILAVNQAFELETNKSREEVIGKNVLSIYPETEPYWIDLFGRVAKSGVAERFTSYSEALHKWYSGLAYSPKPDHVAITLCDQTGFFEKHNTLEQTSKALEAQQQENHRLAHEEPITGLPNRVCLYEAIAQKMQSAPTAEFVLSIISPDNLAGILASYGSLLSDAIMHGIAQRLNDLFPKSGVCYSMTGTDLVLLLPFNCEGRTLRESLTRAQKAILQPVNIDGMDYYISASCGAACFPKDGIDRDELIMKANLALYQAKQTGESIVFFSEQISQRLHNRLLIRNALPKALTNRELELFFQPQIDLVADRMTGFEALLRWHSEELGEVSPRDFIPVAEGSRLIIPIGAWVLERACIALKQVNEKFCTNYCVAVNVSGVQLFADDFVDQVLAVLERTCVDPSLLELEVTESVLINREFHAIEKICALIEHGVRVALDDFGTGYSSLSMLKDLKITTLKIDKLFIQDPNATLLTKMIVRLGHTLGAEIVAEGVENEEQMRAIRRAGCDRVQGFFKGLPMPLDSLTRFIASKAKI